MFPVGGIVGADVGTDVGVLVGVTWPDGVVVGLGVGVVVADPVAVIVREHAEETALALSVNIAVAPKVPTV